jgi:hypothetical protein
MSTTTALPHIRAQSGSEDRILRYTLGERVIHWVAGLTYVYLLLTGLAFWSPYLILAIDFVRRRTDGALLAPLGRVDLHGFHGLDVPPLARGHARHTRRS